LSTSLYQILYSCKSGGGQNIDCSSHCQIKKVSKHKPFDFDFVPFFLRQFFVRSKTNFLILSFFLCRTPFFCQIHFVVSLLRLLTNRSKQICGLTLFGREKNFLPSFFVPCLSLLLGRGGVVFLEPWCVTTRLGGGKLSISGGRCLRGGTSNGDMCKVSVCHVFVLVG
jgi:hypothetical protein